MFNYRKGKQRYKVDEYGSLYIDHSKINGNERPIIYIGGQMEHRCHVLEQSGFTADPGHNMFTGSWFYDYPVFKNNKKEINFRNFGENLLKALKVSGLDDVDLITESYGGLIGAYATQSSSIHQVVSIHPPILGTPLADKTLLKSQLKNLDYKQKIVATIVKTILNDNYGFEQENKMGINNPELQYTADLTKLLVVGSNIDPKTEKNKVIKILYSIIYAISKEKSDGVVLFNPETFNKFGIKYLEEKENLSHFDAGSKEHIDAVYKKTLENFSMKH